VSLAGEGSKAKALRPAIRVARDLHLPDEASRGQQLAHSLLGDLRSRGQAQVNDVDDGAAVDLDAALRNVWGQKQQRHQAMAQV
jgi:hypothetical protein